MSVMKLRLSLIPIVLLLPSTNGFADSGVQLDCSGKEPERIAKAPAGTRRASPHELQVPLLHGFKSFSDEPPFDQDLDGKEWWYCGYDPASKLYLIGLRDNDLFTGVLLRQETGEVVQAGQTVMISPNGIRYFASRQPSGMDGEEWFIFKTDGSVVWKGDSDTDRRSKPAWNGKGQLQARYRCGSEDKNDVQSKIVTLTDRGSGRWDWLPQKPCR